MQSFAVTRTSAGRSAELLFVPSLDELYLPVLVRRPAGDRPCPVIVMGRGNGRGGVEHLEREAARVAAMQDRMLERGYAVAYVNYRNEVPHLYARSEPARRMHDDMSGGENRTLKSAATLDSDDLGSVWRYLQTQSWARADAIGAIGISHGGEMILKAAAEGAPLAAGVIAEGASHEFLSVNTGPTAPRRGGELQYQDIETVRANADKARALARIRNIRAPLLHLAREGDHLQGIFQLAHEWMLEAGGPSQWACYAHPDHGYALMYPGADGRLRPDPVQQDAFDAWMGFFDRHLQAA